MDLIHKKMNEGKEKKVLICCGIVKDEVKLLIEKNHWNLQPIFLPSSLHIDFDRLKGAVTKAIDKFQHRDIKLCYGCCHPQFGAIETKHDIQRTNVQNCVDLILGRSLFNQHLEQGAFFLFEDWATNWKKVITPIFGDDELILQELFQSEHKYLLAITTECSGDFTNKAEEISQKTKLPLKWYHANLSHLENRLKEVLK